MNYYIVDVFAEEKYAGNQLAVVSAEEDLTVERMQQIAGEFHFSETTFVFPALSSDAGWRVRIFTPVNELPFAGHPTLGTAHIIRNKLINDRGDAELPAAIILDLDAGKTPVTFDAGGLLWMRQKEPVFGIVHEPDRIAGIVGLEPEEIDGRFPVQDVSTGIPFTIIPVKSLAAVKKAGTNLQKYKTYYDGKEAVPVFIFCPDSYEADHHINCRMFADEFGISEDPATGSANGCLAGYLVKYRYFGTDEIDLQVEQGYEIGRKSILYLKARETEEPAGAAIEVNVGGRVVQSAEGRLL